MDLGGSSSSRPSSSSFDSAFWICDDIDAVLGGCEVAAFVLVVLEDGCNGSVRGGFDGMLFRNAASFASER